VPSNKFWKFTIHTNTHNLQMLPPQGQGRTFPGQGLFTHLSGSSVSLLAIPDSGFRFNTWLVNGQIHSSNSSLEFPITDNSTVQAVFENVDASVSNIFSDKIQLYAHEKKLFINTSIHVHSIDIYDTNGRKIFSFSPGSSGSYVFDLDSPSGVYVANLTTAIGSLFKKLFIK